MSTKRFNELKNMTADELKTRLRESEKQMFDAKMKHVTGQLGNTAQLWQLRKVPVRFTSIRLFHSVSVMSIVGLRKIWPAELTRISIRPNRFTIVC